MAARVNDCAAYLIKELAPLPVMKLHRLCYYAQAWHLVWQGEPLFEAEIAAWAAGPALPDLYKLHRGRFEPFTYWPDGDSARIDQSARQTLDAIILSYGQHEPLWLAQLAQSEAPWTEAREGLLPGERGQRLIANEALIACYSKASGPAINSIEPSDQLLA